MALGMESDNRIENAGPIVWRDRRTPNDPGQKLVVGNLHQRLEIGEIVIVEARYMGIRERPEKQVNLAHAAMPGAKERPAATRVKVMAGAGQAGHRGLLRQFQSRVNAVPDSDTGL
jgi:hypothetical protein